MPLRDQTLVQGLVPGYTDHQGPTLSFVASPAHICTQESAQPALCLHTTPLTLKSPEQHPGLCPVQHTEGTQPLHSDPKHPVWSGWTKTRAAVSSHPYPLTSAGPQSAVNCPCLGESPDLVCCGCLSNNLKVDGSGDSLGPPSHDFPLYPSPDSPPSQWPAKTWVSLAFMSLVLLSALRSNP